MNVVVSFRRAPQTHYLVISSRGEVRKWSVVRLNKMRSPEDGQVGNRCVVLSNYLGFERVKEDSQISS